MDYKAILYSYAPDEIRPLLKEFQIEELPRKRSSKPDYILVYGGDGTFLTSERDWPGVPKILIRRSRVSNEFIKKAPRKILDFIRKGDFQIKTFPKLVFHLGLIEGVATSDIIIRNLNPNQALRFRLEGEKNTKVPNEEIVGDGLVFATPLGAKGYYRSMTRGDFTKGFSIAFNNPTKAFDPIFLDDDFSVKVKITRENSLVCLDNLPSFWYLRQTEEILVKKHPQNTQIVDTTSFYSPEDQKKFFI